MTVGYKGLQGVTRGYRRLQRVSGGYKGLLGATRGYRQLQMVTRGLQSVIGWLITTT